MNQATEPAEVHDGLAMYRRGDGPPLLMLLAALASRPVAHAHLGNLLARGRGSLATHKKRFAQVLTGFLR